MIHTNLWAESARENAERALRLNRRRNWRLTQLLTATFTCVVVWGLWRIFHD